MESKELAFHHQVPHLKHRNFLFPVDLVSRRVKPAALLHVLVEDTAALHVTETELTQVELWKSGEEGPKESETRPNINGLYDRSMNKHQIHLLYSCGYGDEYHV